MESFNTFNKHLQKGNDYFYRNEGECDNVTSSLNIDRYNGVDAGIKYNVSQNPDIHGFAQIQTSNYSMPANGGVRFSINNVFYKEIKSAGSTFTFPTNNFKSISAVMYGRSVTNWSYIRAPFSFRIIVRIVHH